MFVLGGAIEAFRQRATLIPKEFVKSDASFWNTPYVFSKMKTKKYHSRKLLFQNSIKNS
jgi:hypothetical protein